MTVDYCRLTVLLAREAPKAVILRRGPTEWVQLILWHTDTDTFEEGQWFRGRIYEKMCDVSPDGSKFIYFAAKHHKWATKNPSYGTTWTAISKPPFFTALALWPEIGTYGGGGYFGDNSTIYLNHGYVHPSHKNHLPPKNLIIKTVLEDQHFNSVRSLDDAQLQRCGWVMMQKKDKRYSYEKEYTYDPPGIWQKINGDYKLIMKMVGFHTKSFRELLEFTLLHAPTRLKLTFDLVTWVDWDQQNRLVYVKEGRIFTGQIKNDTLVSTMIADFNTNKPTLLAAPEWAKHW